MSKKVYTTAQRAALMAKAGILLSKGSSMCAAAKSVGVAQSCLTKWFNPPARPAEPKKLGRPRALALTDDEVRIFKRGCLDTGSVRVAVKRMLESPEISADARVVLGNVLHKAASTGKAPAWPTCIREAARIPEIIEAMHRGRKHARAFEPTARRDGTIVMEDGTEIMWSAGCIYESDDMSLNEPFRFTDAGMRRETVGRQGLFSIDAASGFNMGFHLLGRAHDAYRLEDIADHMLGMVEAHGLPLLWRLEMGSWASNFVNGIRIKDRNERWGSLRDLFYVSNKHESTGKANIERSFNESQKLSAHASTCIGRTRGEFETATKLMARAQKGDMQALSYFWTMPECADALDRILNLEENRRPRSYRKLGGIVSTPEALMGERVTRRELAESDRWYFMPVKRTATIRKGVIEFRVDHYAGTFRFLTYEVDGFPIFREGHPVLVAFHPGQPDNDCYVFNAATGQAAKGRAFGELLGRVPVWHDVPEEDLAGTGNYAPLAKAKANIRSEYRAIVPKGTGPGTRQSIARDGLGNALVIQTGNSPQDAPAKPRQPRGEPVAANPRSAAIPQPVGNPRADGVILPPPRTILPTSPALPSRAMPATTEARAAEIERLAAMLEG